MFVKSICETTAREKRVKTASFPSFRFIKKALYLQKKKTHYPKAFFGKTQPRLKADLFNTTQLHLTTKS
jgi:hypothetical protein